MSNVVKSDDKRWRAEADARTLTDYSQIVRDKSRKSAATKILVEQKKSIDQALGGKVDRARKKSTKTYI